MEGSPERSVDDSLSEDRPGNTEVGRESYDVVTTIGETTYVLCSGCGPSRVCPGSLTVSTGVLLLLPSERGMAQRFPLSTRGLCKGATRLGVRPSGV